MRLRSTIASLYALVLMLALPAVTYALSSDNNAKLDKPEGHDGTLTTIFFIALSIPLLIAVLSLIDVARGIHTRRHDEH